MLKNRMVVFGGSVVGIFFLTAIFAPLISPRDPLEQDLYKRLLPPSAEGWLGTDDFGRDLLSRLIYGSRISLKVGVVSVGIALLSGSTLGVISGYYGGWIDNLIMRLMDIMLALPSILLAMVVVAILGPSLNNAMLAVGVVTIPQYARILRSSVLSLRERDYVIAARSLGASDLRIITTAILPNCLAPITVQATLGMGTAILDTSGLSFLGLGAQPPIPEWGAMLNQGKEFIRDAWWVVAAPGAAIFFMVLGFNLLGDGLRDALDPQLK
jgi:ABC-type dipeptide/oligopeptide/nickel transport system permease subunit